MTTRRELITIIVAIVVLCLLGIGANYYAATIMPLSVAMFMAFPFDFVMGYAFLAGLLLSLPAPSAEPTMPNPPVATPSLQVLPPKATAVPQRQSKPAKAAPRQPMVKPRPTERAATGDVIVSRLAALPDLADIDQGDIAKVVEQYRRGTKVGQIYKALHWGSRRHKDTIKPVVDALKSMTAQKGQRENNE